MESGIEETLTCCDFPSEHWTSIRTNNVFERLNREIRRRIRVWWVLSRTETRLRCWSVAGCAIFPVLQGCNKKYMSMKYLKATVEGAYSL